jgi:pyruvate kinase
MLCSPVTEAPENAVKLIDEGLNVARLNFSHGDHAEHRRQMTGVMEAMTKRANAHVAFMLDTKGPEIRTGNNEDGKAVEVKAGDLLEISNCLLK